MKKIILVEIISYFFVLLFLYTGLMKLIDFQLFRLSLAKSPLLNPFGSALGILVPVVELLVALSLLAPRTQNLGLRCSSIMMGVFTLYVGYMIYFLPHRLPCSCGGIIKEMNWHQHLYFNILSTLIALLALRMNSIQLKRSGQVVNSIL